MKNIYWYILIPVDAPNCFFLKFLAHCMKKSYLLTTLSFFFIELRGYSATTMPVCSMLSSVFVMNYEVHLALFSDTLTDVD